MRLPKLAAGLLLAGLLAWIAAASYTLKLNPEVRHFVYTDQLKEKWGAEMTQAHGAKVIVYGGSSCEFSIDGERMLKRFSLPCVNAGRGAGMGIAVLTMAALRDCRTNDTLIVAIEPVLLTEPLDTPNLGIQFSIAAGHPEWIMHPFPPADPVSAVEAALALRPGGYHTFTLLGKLVQGREFYRYQPQDVRPSGWIQTPVRVKVSGPPRHGIAIPQDCIRFLQSLQTWCRTRHMRLAYSLPWGFTPPDQTHGFQMENARLLLQILDIMPVLRDPRLGAHPLAQHFSDSVWHLTEEGAALRTDEFAQTVLTWSTWTRAELERFLAGQGDSAALP